jgi:hypothetical protein
MTFRVRTVCVVALSVEWPLPPEATGCKRSAAPTRWGKATDRSQSQKFEIRATAVEGQNPDGHDRSAPGRSDVR